MAQPAPARALSAGLRALSATALVLLALATVDAAGAAAAPGWLPAVNLSANRVGPEAGTPHVAVDPRGDAVAVWDRGGIIRSASRPAGGVWSAPVDLSAKGQTAESPRVAVDSKGEAVAVWGGYDGIQSASRRPGRAWSKPVTLSRRVAFDPQVAVDPRGDAVAVWWAGSLQSASRPAPGARPAPGGGWSAPVRLSGAGQFPPRVAVDSQGDAVAVWIHQDGSNRVVQSASCPAGGTWSAPVRLSAAGRNAAHPGVGVDPRGDAVAVWILVDGNHIVQSASRRAGGTWSAPVDLSSRQRKMDAMDPHVAVDSRGDAVAVWSLFNSSLHFVIQSASRPAGGAWSAPADLYTAPQIGQITRDPRIAVDSRGDAVAIWESDSIIRSASRPAGGAWSAPVTLSAPAPNVPYHQHAFQLDVAVDPRGDAVAVWLRSGDRRVIVQAASREAAAPRGRAH